MRNINSSIVHVNIDYLSDVYIFFVLDKSEVLTYVQKKKKKNVLR